MTGPVIIDVQLYEPQALADAQAALGDTLLLVQVTSAETFAQAHPPGAVLVEPAELVSGEPPATGKLPSAERIAAVLERIGYSPERQVVALDDEGGGWAGRLLWTLDCIGRRDWGYLNGGLHAWHGAGLPLVNGPCTATPANAPVTVTIDRSPIADQAEVLAAIDDPEVQIWDVRSAAEHAGLRRAAARVGHIPGALNTDWLLLQDPDRQYRLLEDLPGFLAEAGLEPASKAIITHCQTHHRSSLSYLVGRLLGFHSIRAYDGSWSEWGNDPNTPIHNPAAGEERS
ncbi:MAG: rhodanese-like domain-containing protein [Pseudomonadota bacterium]